MVRHRVGIVGLQAGRSWAAVAHLPALRSLPNDFEIVGVANTSRASAEAAAAACDIPRAFDGVDELVQSPEVDVVVVAVKVPHHLEVVTKALLADKHVVCEWPLGNGLAEAEKLAALARSRKTMAVIGTQARTAPTFEYLADLVSGGFVGDLLSTTLVARGGSWGPSIPETKTRSYVLDRNNGATMLSIAFGHTMAGLHDVLGRVTDVSAIMTTRRNSVLVTSTGEHLPQTSPDQLVVSGLLAGGAPLSAHFRGGMARDGAHGFFWEIHGSDGDLEISGGPSGNAQIIELTVRGAQGDGQALETLPVPAAYYKNWPDAPTDAADVYVGMAADMRNIPGNVLGVYARMARDLRDGTRTAPTFEDALEIHRLMAAIEEAATSGCRVHV